MNQLTSAGRTAAQLHAAAATAHQIAARREAAHAAGNQPGPAAGPCHAATSFPGHEPGVPSARIRKIVSRIRAAGLAADVDETEDVGLYLLVSARHPCGPDIDIVLGEDGYAELQWCPCPDASADQITGQLLGLLNVLTASPAPAAATRGPDPAPQPSRPTADSGTPAT